MLIDSDTPTNGPLNGLVRVCLSKEGAYEEVDLDYECMWRDKDGYLVFKCYDRSASIVYLKMKEREVIDAIMDLMWRAEVDPEVTH